MINQACILAGGLGTRLNCVDKPKPLYKIPAGGTPVLGHLLNEMLAAGVNDFVVVVPSPEVNDGWRDQIEGYVDLITTGSPNTPRFVDSRATIA